MALQKRLEYGFNGYQVPPIPQTTRSARRRDLYSFDALATAAGLFSLAEECDPTDNKLPGRDLSSNLKDPIKKEQQDEEVPLKGETFDQGSPNRSFSFSEHGHQSPVLNNSLKEPSCVCYDDCLEHASGKKTTLSDKVGSDISDIKLVDAKNKFQHGSFANKVVAASCGHVESFDCTLEGESKGQIKIGPPKIESVSNNSSADFCCFCDLVVRDGKSPPFVSVENTPKLLSCPDQSPSANQEDVKLVFRDDDQNFSRCIKPSITSEAFRPSPCIGNQRIGKSLASEYWKVTPNLEDKECPNADSVIKPVNHNWEICCKGKKSQRDYPFKKRKFRNFCSASNSHGGVGTEGIASTPDKVFGSGATPLASREHGVPRTSAGEAVKLRIKSFKVPDLFIEISESATVGSLKRTVMEAVTSILGGGLRVGVLLQGKKIRDDNKTLLQTGISHDSKLDALGFSLEPNASQATGPVNHENRPFLLNCGSGTPQALKRYTPASSGVKSAVRKRTSDSLSDLPLANLSNILESDHDLMPSPPDLSIDKNPANSQALFTVPTIKAEALAVVPVMKIKSEAVQRRVRRPFSVSEVEALVQAVEKLGTGRWRDVKLRAFDNVNHRTYVDLKDKWKTLVHTARISPQQRRGEPVPQELLDRVLAAHAYWSQQQPKQHLKQLPESLHLL
ncbi:telomere repeat-binding protein 5-like isoform X2 [Diospyros lotus]|uniref:telomere repeat-binding protein 5-like isoform X2 n=1 Tax=Diospyros lotus TaxID=55363 RepID=UPI0022573F79|nr:telomere repeat-binding protein 5-like isoform X2 [Diospyros lotus]